MNYLLAFGLRHDGEAYRIVDMLHGVDAHAIQSHCTPADLVRGVAINLKRPSGRNITKKITEMPDGGEVEVHYVICGIEVAANNKGLEQREMKVGVLIIVLGYEGGKPLGVGKCAERSKGIINFALVEMLQSKVGAAFSNLSFHIANFERIDLLFRAEICEIAAERAGAQSW